MAEQMSDDERFARQLQQQEYAEAQMVNAGIVEGGNVIAGGQVMQGMQDSNMPVVHGRPVGGPIPSNDPSGYGRYIMGPGGPGGAPTFLGMGQHGSMPHAIAIVPDIPPEEAVVLNYRMSLLCFTVIDAVSTLLNAAALVRTATSEEEEAEEPNNSVFGFHGLVRSKMAREVIGIGGLVFLVGPLCGFLGARTFNRGLITVYLIFCVVKTTFEIVLTILTPWLWYIIVALVQAWVTKIVYTFWAALGRISPEKIKELADPNYIQNVRARVVYW